MNRSRKRERIKLLCISLSLLLGIFPSPGVAMMVSLKPLQFTRGSNSRAASLLVATSNVDDSVTTGGNRIYDDGQSKTPIPFDLWLDRTTDRLLNLPPPNQDASRAEREENPHSPYSQHHTSSPGYIPLGELTIDDVQLIATLMTSHARRGTFESALTCERLLKRVVEEVNAGNTNVAATTRMYTITMDAWARAQRRPSPASINYGSKKDNANVKRQAQLQVHPEQLSSRRQSQIPLGAAAQRAHRIHNSLVAAYKQTGDPHLAPSAVSCKCIAHIVCRFIS